MIIFGKMILQANNLPDIKKIKIAAKFLGLIPCCSLFAASGQQLPT